MIYFLLKRCLKKYNDNIANKKYLLYTFCSLKERENTHGK